MAERAFQFKTETYYPPLAADPGAFGQAHAS